LKKRLLIIIFCVLGILVLPILGGSMDGAHGLDFAGGYSRIDSKLGDYVVAFALPEQAGIY
jgi:hypothetical protein